MATIDLEHVEAIRRAVLKIRPYLKRVCRRAKLMEIWDFVSVSGMHMGTFDHKHIKVIWRLLGGRFQNLASTQNNSLQSETDETLGCGGVFGMHMG